jgi:hypothetical protein
MHFPAPPNASGDHPRVIQLNRIIHTLVFVLPRNSMHNALLTTRSLDSAQGRLCVTVSRQCATQLVLCPGHNDGVSQRLLS